MKLRPLVLPNGEFSIEFFLIKFHTIVFWRSNPAERAFLLPPLKAFFGVFSKTKATILKR